MARKMLLVLLIGAILFGSTGIGSLSNPGKLANTNKLDKLSILKTAQVSAQDQETSPEDQRLIDQYHLATQKCADPSLECLVHYTVKYIMIELTGGIVPIGSLTNPQATPTPGNGGPGSSINHGIDVAKNNGVVPALTYWISEMYANPPANTHTYVADLMDSAHIAKPAYAQGLGYGSLSPILNLWKTFRNVAYMFYVFLFIVIGFLIMFRRKVGSTAITAQQAIPSIIISLLFVTFSYAIAGFLIDIMYLVMYMIIGIFKVTFPQSNADIINYDIFSFAATFIKSGAREGFDTGRNVVGSLLSGLIEQHAMVGGTFAWVGGITVGLVVAVAVLLGAFKLFFELLRSYATIVLSVVVAPMQLMASAIPGNNSISSWMKNLIANLAAFPTVLLVAVMFYIFTEDTTVNSGGFMPPFLVGRGQSDAIANIMGLAILLAMPEIVKEVKKKLGASEGFGAMVLNAAAGRFKEGVPIGTMIPAAGLGAATGGLGGFTKGMFLDGGWRKGGVGLASSMMKAGRGAGNVMSLASRGSQRFSGAIGAKSPGLLAPAEKGLGYATTSMSDDERLKRIAERKNWFGRVSYVGGTNYARKLKIAEQQAAQAAAREKRLIDGKFGEWVEP